MWFIYGTRFFFFGRRLFFCFLKLKKVSFSSDWGTLPKLKVWQHECYIFARALLFFFLTIRVLGWGGEYWDVTCCQVRSKISRLFFSICLRGRREQSMVLKKKTFFNACSYLLDYIIYITNASLSGVWFLILACFFKLSSCCKDFLSLFSFFFFFYRRLQVLQKHLGYFPWSVLFMIFKHKKKINHS